MDVRPGRSGEGAALQDVERAAGLQFHQVGMASIAEDAGSAVLRYAHMILLADRNRPLYEHLGFVVVREDRLSTVLREVRAHEISCGLDAAGARVAMRLTI